MFEDRVFDYLSPEIKSIIHVNETLEGQRPDPDSPNGFVMPLPDPVTPNDLEDIWYLEPDRSGGYQHKTDGPHSEMVIEAVDMPRGPEYEDYVEVKGGGPEKVSEYLSRLRFKLRDEYSDLELKH